MMTFEFRLQPRWQQACGALAAVTFAALAGCAQGPAAAPPVDETPAMMTLRSADAPGTEAASFTFAPGDEFDLRVPDAAQLDQSSRVRPDGNVSLPLIGTVRMEGRTVESVQTELRERLDALAGDLTGRDYLLRPNDEIEIKFPFQPLLNEMVRLRPDGKVQLQMIGMVQAEGRSPEELKTELVERYGRWLRRPELAVIVRSATSQSVRVASDRSGRAGLRGLRPVILLRSFQAPQIFVAGEVSRPGVFAYRPGLSLLQAMAEAGGQLPSGDVKKMMILRRAPHDLVELIPAALDQQRLQAGARDVLLRPFDVIILPKTGVATLADNLNQYVFNLVPFLRNSSFGISYQVHGYTQP